VHNDGCIQVLIDAMVLVQRLSISIWNIIALLELFVTEFIPGLAIVVACLPLGMVGAIVCSVVSFGVMCVAILLSLVELA
jgi:hypothetical protein